MEDDSVAHPLPATPGVEPRRVRLGGRVYIVTGLPVQEAPVWEMITIDGERLSEHAFLALPEAYRRSLVDEVKLYLLSISGG